MRLTSVRDLSFSRCVVIKRLLAIGLVLGAAGALLPSAWTQNSKQNFDQSVSILPSDSQKPESAKETNDRIAQLAIQQAKKTDYVLNSGDLLGVEVFDVTELTREVRVSDSGFISLPLLPVKVRAEGLTAFQLQDKVAELLAANGLVSNPQVTVTVKEQHGEPITVIGSVKTPMVIQAVRSMTLLEVLSRAGGITDDASGQILITHAPQQPVRSLAPGDIVAKDAQEPTAIADAQTEADDQITADPLTLRIGLNDLLDTGNPKYNVTLTGGDVVSVPRAGVVYAVGGVQKPGGFVMASDRQQLTVLKVLSLSGGWTSTAKPRNAVIIRQSLDANQQEVPVDLERILARKEKDPELQQSDILFVPISGGKQAMGRVAQAAMAIATGVTVVRLGR